ncbi:MAG: galactokinase [Enterobacteriaceae bacterium]
MPHTLIERVSEAFCLQFYHYPTHLIQAPGRVNLIGEHTDYNEGFVLPCAINYQTVVAASPRKDSEIHVWAVDYCASDCFDLQQPIVYSEQALWKNYIRGVLHVLQQWGFKPGGMNIAVSGNIPQGAGLSSSASLEVAIAQTTKTLWQLPITQQEIALVGQQAENQFVGCNCGIMDQLISACGQRDHALLIDCRSLALTPVTLPPERVVMIVNSNKQRGLVDSEYNSRRQQCEAAASVLGVKSLRDVSLADLKARAGQMDELIYKRARHVVSENMRTLAAVEALSQGDLQRLGQLMAQSHASMRDDFQITVPEIDALVEIMQQAIGDQGGVRMTGGGFGGCVVALITPQQVQAVSDAIAQHYQSRTGLQATIYLCQASDGAAVINGNRKVAADK